MNKNLYFFILLLIFFVSCGSDLQNNLNSSLGNSNDECFEFNACNPGLICENNLCVDAPKITKDTVIITEGESNNELIESSGNKLVFLKNERTSLFKKGYNIAFEDTDIFENGFIGKIEKVEDINNQIVVTTKEISPFEILGSVKLNIDRNIYFDSPIDPSVSNTDKSINKTLNYSKSFYRDTFKINGTMSVKYNFKMFIDIRRYANTIYTTYHLIKFDLTNNLELTSDLTLKLNAVSYTNQKMKIRYRGADLLPKQKLSTFTVYFPYHIKTKGEVYLSIRALYSGNLQGKADIKIKTKSNFKSGIKYENNRTSKIANYDTQKLNLDDNVKIDGRAGITFKVTPEVKFKAYSTSVTNDVTIGTEILYTQALLDSTIDTVANPKSCYSIEGIASLNPYATLNLMTLYRHGTKASNGVNMTWSKSNNPKVKNFNWLDNKCENFSCNNIDDCHINQKTMGDTCNGGTCSNSDSNNNYEFVDIPEGDFKRGCVDGDEYCNHDETPTKTVHLTAYKIGKKEVTVSQYKECVNANSCIAPTSGNYVESEGGNYPINNISWKDAQRYCSWLGGTQGFVRLPTEAEWENAAKGGNNSLYPWGDAKPTCDITVKESEDGDGCGKLKTAEVGTKSGDLSGYGVMDMGGNVSEFTNDYYDPSYYAREDSLNNPKGPIKPTNNYTYIVVRGGDWRTHKEESFRNSRRLAIKSVIKSDSIGFRCVYKEEHLNEDGGIGTVDKPIELGTLEPGYTHDDERDTHNATSDYFDSYPSSTVAEYGKEFIYHFKVTKRVRIILNIDTPEPSGTDIDLNLFRNLSASNPGLVQRDDKKIEAVIEPGDYYISMDSFGGENSTHEGKYKLHIKVEDAEMTSGCSNLSKIELNTSVLPYSHTETKDTNNAPNDCFNTYPPNSTKEYGKEYIYHFKTTKKVDADFYIKSPEPNGTDIDLQLFRVLDKARPNLVDRSDKSIHGVLEPGDYYLSLDSYGAEGSTKEGSYKLTIKLKEYVPVPDGDWFNPYMIKAVNYINSHYKNGGYNLHKRYTHRLKYGDIGHNNSSHSGYLTYYTGGSLTMCSAAVTEVIIVAMQIYAKETGDWSVFDKFTRSKWDNSFIPWQFPMGSTGSKGVGDAVEHFNMGKRTAFKKLLPGAAINFNRGSGYGHAVIFIAFLDKQGNTYNKYPSGKTVIGFKYYSAQTITNGMGYRLAIWNDYRTWAKTHFCNKSSLTHGLPCDNHQTIRTGSWGPNSAMFYMPSRWNP